MFDGLRLALIRRLATITGQSTPNQNTAPEQSLTETLRRQGNALIAGEKFEEAERCFRQALLKRTDDAQLLVCLGYVLKEQARFAEARIPLRRATLIKGSDADCSEAHYLLAEISELQNDPEDAKRHLHSALGLKPDFTRACAHLIRLMRQTGEESNVLDRLVQSVNECPDSLDYRLWLAEVCAGALDYQATVDQLTAVIRLGGGNVRVYITIGAALCRLDRLRDAQPYFDIAAEQDPSVAYEIYYHQGYFHSRIGNSNEAIALFEESIKLQTSFLVAHQMLLFNLCFAQPMVDGRYKEAARRFNSAIRPETQVVARFSIRPKESVLRVGFSCGEFRNHPVFYFLIGVLEKIDRSKFHLVAYSNNEIDDQMTQLLKAEMDEWHDIRAMSDDGAAELIRSNQIDVLIDLCGHSGEARLPIFARRPAPVQIAWLGYFASTGVDEMDYIIADPTSVPEDSTEWFSETVIRMPATRLCMTKPKPSREISVAQPPCIRKGHVTFGSFQQAAKITPKVLQTWSQVMEKVPNSRLRIQSSAFGSAAVCERVAAGMSAAKIDLTRVEMLGSMPWEDYLEAHGEVDMLIDTFPYTGGTTTAFALWMGVPVLSILGNTMLSRQGATMLDCVGLPNWIARDEEDYVDKAVKFSENIQYMVQLRAGLREVTERSPLFDTERFTREFEKTLLDIDARCRSAS